MSLASNELTLYIDNTQRLWKVKRDVWARLAKRKVGDNYDAELAERAFMSVANQGAKAYVREMKMAETWSTAFPATDRKCVAKDYEKEFRARWKTGELDYLLPLKQRPKRRNMVGNPVRRGYTRKIVSDNVATLIKEGRSQKQAIAIALEVARDSYRSRYPNRDLPGYLSSPPASSNKRSAKKAAPMKKTTPRKKVAKKTTRKKTTAKKATTRKKKTSRARSQSGFSFSRMPSGGYAVQRGGVYLGTVYQQEDNTWAHARHKWDHLRYERDKTRVAAARRLHALAKADPIHSFGHHTIKGARRAA